MRTSLSPPWLPESQVIIDNSCSDGSADDQATDGGSDNRVHRRWGGNRNCRNRWTWFRFTIRPVALFSLALSASNLGSVRGRFAVTLPVCPRAPTVTVDLFESRSTWTDRAGGVSASNPAGSNANSAPTFLVVTIARSPRWPAPPISRTRLSVASSLGNRRWSDASRIGGIAGLHPDLVSASAFSWTLWPLCPVLILDLLRRCYSRDGALRLWAAEPIFGNHLTVVRVDGRGTRWRNAVREPEPLLSPWPDPRSVDPEQNIEKLITMLRAHIL